MINNMGEKIETNSTALGYRRYVNEHFAKYNFDEWFLGNLQLKPGLRVLDLGCGTGKHLFRISELVFPDGEVSGLDISNESLEKCRREIKNRRIGNVRLYNCDLTQISEQIQQTFDRISSSFAVYYTSNEEKTFRDCYNLLRKGGIMFFCGPAKKTNREFIQLVERAGGRKNSYKWTNFLEDRAVPLLERIAGEVELSFFENPIVFPDEGTLFQYWKSTALYDPNLEDNMWKVIKKEFEKSKTFTNTKIISGVKCRK